MALAPNSPRLPSPPPPAEIQIGPNSPSDGANATLQASDMEQSLLDASSLRRIHPGTKAADMTSGPPLVPLNELNSAFQLQEHLAASHHHHTSSNREPITRDTALKLAQPPEGIDRTLWLYELCRFLTARCNSLIIGFLFDSPPCSASTCPEMRASEWQFLCAVHEQPKSCCAIDYCCHTMDWAANVVTDQKIFPSRFVVLADAHSKNVGVKNLVNVFRRLHRIFAHAWFQHRSVFWSVEGQTGLYVFFKMVCDLYDLLPAENYQLPPEAEGLESLSPESDPEAERTPAPSILKPPSQIRQTTSGEEDDNQHQVGRTNTRRHIRSNPSTGSAVTTVMEAEEEDSEGVARGMKNMYISGPSITGDDVEVAIVPVVVDQGFDNPSEIASLSSPSPKESEPVPPVHTEATDDTAEESSGELPGETAPTSIPVELTPEPEEDQTRPGIDAVEIASRSDMKEDAASADAIEEPLMKAGSAENAGQEEELNTTVDTLS